MKHFRETRITGVSDGLLRERYLLLDRDTKYAAAIIPFARETRGESLPR
jgi:hypothetical protein